MNILCGIHPTDEGAILTERAPACIEQPKDALALGINMIHQEFASFSELSVAENVFVGVAKAPLENLRILIMNEAASSLNLREAEQLFATIEALKAEGISTVYISHRLKELLNIAGRISVLRDGANVGIFSKGQIDEEAIIEAMLGRRLQGVEKKASSRGASVFSVSNLNIPGKLRLLQAEVVRHLVKIGRPPTGLHPVSLH
jgi:ABC-type sugar transport system ATPase subunit